MMMEAAEAEAEVEVKPSSPGQMLRAAREAKDWKVEHVAGQLKLSRRQIEALEADAFTELPGLTFVRGFVRNYARLLDVDADPILALLDRHASPDTTFEIKAPPLAKLPRAAGGYPGQRKPPYRLVLTMLGMVAFTLGGFAWFNYSHVEPELQMTPATAPTPAAPQPAPVVAPIVPVAPATEAASATPAPAEPVAGTETAAAPAAPSASSAPAAPAVETAPAQQAVAAGSGQLRLTFEGDSWVDIRDADGNKVVARLYRPGAEDTLSGKPPFKLVIGNAAQVKLFYNGQPVDLAAHVKVNVARLQLD